MTATISIIVPVYNTEYYLRDCLDSLLKHSNNEVEIILVNDGSTDNSGTICNDYANRHPKLVRVIHQKNKGLGGARNTGIDAAMGDYLFFIDSDDYVELETIPTLLTIIRKHDVDMIVFRMGKVDDEGAYKGIINDAFSPYYDRELSLEKYPMILNIQPSACNKLIHRRVFTSNGIRFPDKVWYEDIRTYTKIYPLLQTVLFVKYRLYNYRFRNGSIMNNVNLDRNIEIIDAFEDIMSFYKENELFDKYQKELELLALRHVYIYASSRVAKVDTKNPLLEKYRNFMLSNYPEYARNPHIQKLTKNEKLIFELLQRKKYGLVQFIFRLKHGLS